MHFFLDKFHQDGEQNTRIASHQVELRREENFTEQQYLSISSLKTNYLNLDRSSGYSRNNERSNIVQTKCTFYGGTDNFTEKCFKKISKDKLKSRAACDQDRQRTERTPCKCFRWGSVYCLIDKCPKPPKDK